MRSQSGREDLNLRPHGPEPQTSILHLRPHGEAILGSRVVFGAQSPWWSTVALCGSAQSGILNSGNGRIIADAVRRGKSVFFAEFAVSEPSGSASSRGDSYYRFSATKSTGPTRRTPSASARAFNAGVKPALA